MDTTPIYHLPQDALHQIFSSLPLRQLMICKSVSKFFNQILSSQSFIDFISTKPPPLQLLALRPPHHSHHSRHVSINKYVHAFDPDSNQWLRFGLTFLPFRSPSPVASSLGLIYMWGDSVDSGKSLVVCNPLTRRYRVLPQLGSAWSKHGSVLVGQFGRVLVLSELATLYLSPNSDQWLNFPSNLPSKPRSPILVSSCVYALCDVGSPWRSQWKLYFCTLTDNSSNSTRRLQFSSESWCRLEMHKWGDVFDILKRPRLVPGVGNKLLMVGGLKSSFSLHANCSTIVILRLDLETMEWDKAGRMPVEMFRSFGEYSSKFKVFGGGNRVCFSGKKVGKLALWEEGGGENEWRWIEGLPGNGDWLCRGFMFEASLSALP